MHIPLGRLRVRLVRTHLFRGGEDGDRAGQRRVADPLLSALGSAVQPEVTLNGEVAGREIRGLHYTGK
jgi:hypothetical protein